jgi:arogenate dehydrogenase (NADP+)
VIITDVASLKGFIIDFVNTSHKPINFIGGHPMAGTENKGFESSFSGLFQDSKWILTPSKWSNNEQISDLKEIISELGAKVIIADAQEHDKAAALISHLPLFLSQSLFKLVKDFPNTNISKLAMSMASSGFRDTTRLAATNPELSSDILKENLLNVLSSFRELINSSSILEKLLIEDQEGFISLCEEISEARKKIYSPEGKNIVDL